PERALQAKCDQLHRTSSDLASRRQRRVCGRHAPCLREKPLSQFFKASGLVGFPGIAARALPVEVARLEAADLAGITVEALRVAMNDGPQQAEVRTCSNLEHSRGARRG